MKWNWQLEEWPEFTWDTSRLQRVEEAFLHQSGLMIGAFRHLQEEDKDLLKVELITTEAAKSSEIEGEILNRDSIQSSLRRQFGLQNDHRRIPPAEQGIAEMMISLFRGYAEPLSHEVLHHRHRQLTLGRQDLYDIGCYRRHKGPMQVISGSIHDPVVHYEAPPSDQVQEEMNAFVAWFNTSSSLPLLTRAGIAHLYFVSIHPYEDGNGRIGRAVAEKALAQGIGHPALTSLSAEIESAKKAYYASLAAVNRQLDLTEWLCWFSDLVLRSVQNTETRIQFLIDKTRMFDRLRGRLNPRQEKVLERMFREGPSGFTGGLSARNYLAITKTSRATATRDLVELVEIGALRKTGQRKGTRYHLQM